MTTTVKRFTPELRRVVVVVSLGASMAMLDSSIVNVALRVLALDLHAELATIQWVVTAYLLALAAVVPVTGWAARRVGARRLYVYALAAFTVTSMLCGLAANASQLIVFRALQGAAGGLLLVGQIILVRQAGKAFVTRAISAVAVPTVLGPVIAPTIGGLLLTGASWRWIFYVNVPIGIVAVVLAVLTLPRDVPEPVGRLDLRGLLLAGPGAVGVSYGLAELARPGRDSPVGWIALGLGLVLLAAFTWHALRVERPLLDIRLLSSPAVSAAAGAIFCFGALVYGGTTLMPLYYQVIREQDAVTTGLLLAPQGVGAVVAMWLGGRIAGRVGGGRTVVIGGVIAALASVPLVLIGPDTSYLWLSVALTGRGLGVGMAAMSAMAAGFVAVDPAKVNDASPQFNFFQRLGGSVGTVVFLVVLQQHLDAGGGAGAFGTAMAWTLAATALGTLLAIVLSLRESQRR